MNKQDRMDRILLGSLVRNRAKILEQTLRQLIKLDYDKQAIGCHFVVNDSTDESFKILQDFKRQYERQYRFIEVIEVNLGTPPDLRSQTHVQGDGQPFAFNRQPIYQALCELHNRLLDRLREDKEAKYLFVVDSDTRLYSMALAELIKARRKVITTIQAVDYGREKILGIWRWDEKRERNVRIQPGELKDMPKVFEVGIIGGTWLLSREIADKGLRYEYIEGKAEQVSFCEKLQEVGYKIYALRDMVATHMMKDNLGDY